MKVAEPMTVITDVVLGLFAFVLSMRLASVAAIGEIASAGCIALGLLATSWSAVLAAVAHAIDPQRDQAQHDRAWRGALYTSGLIGAATVASVAYFTVTGAMRVLILLLAAAKLATYTITVTRRPDFRVAAADYGGALAMLLAGAAYAYIRWRAPAAPWLLGEVLVSLVAGVAQARQVAFHRHFNHNDLYHVIQLVAVYLFYRGGVLLVDR
jgi:hypothetical protein